MVQQISYDLSKVKALKNLQKRRTHKNKNPHGYTQGDGEKVRVRFENGQSYMRIEVCVWERERGRESEPKKMTNQSRQQPPLQLHVAEIWHHHHFSVQHNYEPESCWRGEGGGGGSHSPHESAATQTRKVHLQSRTPDMVEIPAGGC